MSVVISDNVIDCVKHLVEYLSCRVFGQAIYRHMTHKNKAVVKEVKITFIFKVKAIV